MNPETRLKNSVMRMIKKEFPGVWAWKISDLYTSGIPDLLLVNDGAYLWVELKTNEGEASEIQKHTIKRLRSKGCFAVIATSVKEVKDLISKILLKGGQKA